MVCAEKSLITLIHTVGKNKCKHAPSILSRFKRVLNVPLPWRVIIMQLHHLRQLSWLTRVNRTLYKIVKRNKIKQYFLTIFTLLKSRLLQRINSEKKKRKEMVENLIPCYRFNLIILSYCVFLSCFFVRSYSLGEVDAYGTFSISSFRYPETRLRPFDSRYFRGKGSRFIKFSFLN